MDLKIPPHSEQAEQSLLGCILMSKDVLYQVMDIKPEHFYFEKHQLIFESMLRIKEGNLDLLTIENDLEKRNEHEKVGGLSYISELQISVPTHSHFRSYADIVKDKYKRRMVIKTGNMMMGMGYDEEQSNVTDIISKCQSVLEESVNDAVEDDLTGCGDLMEEVFNHYSDRMERKNKGIQLGLPTGFDFLQFEPKELITIAALSGVGKSILASNIAANVSKWRNTLFFSFEMSKTEIMYRLLSVTNNVNLSSMTNCEVSEDVLAKYMGRYKTECGNLKIYDNTLTMNEVIMMTKKEIILNGVDLVVIDYAQITGDEFEDVVKKTRYVTRKAKQLAQDLGVTVIILSQFNRDGEKQGFPKASQLLGGTSVKQDSNQIYILHNPTLSDEESGSSSIEPLYILRKVKDRNSNACKKDYFLKREQDFMSFSISTIPPKWAQQ